MITIKFNLHYTKEGFPYHDFEDIWDSGVDEAADWFIIRFCQELIELKDYFFVHTSTDFGNPDYNHIDGWVHGVCFAKKWDIVAEKDREIYKCGKKYRIEVEIDDEPRDSREDF